MHISFIGNCQLLTLCFYFQQLLDTNENSMNWLLYGHEFRSHLGGWTTKCKNLVLDDEKSIEIIKTSDIIIFQEISEAKSAISNSSFLKKNIKQNCILLKIPSVFLDYNAYNDSLNDLQTRETINNVDIRVSDILHKYKDTKLMLTKHHPTTFLFMEIIKKICVTLDLPFFTNNLYNHFLLNDNYMGLP